MDHTLTLVTDATALCTDAASIELTPPAEAWVQRAEWAARRARLARTVRGARGPRNLVPRPQPQYWQNAPEAPLHMLKSEASRAHLACCNMQSSMLLHQDERGRAAYACAAGETHFWRRHPDKVANTLAFMLGEESAEMERVRGAKVLT